METRNILLSAFCLILGFCGNAQDKPLFTNPILAGFYPDPSICRVGSDYYLVNSTFSYFPGIPIHQSKDLVNWKLIGHVLDRAEQLNLDKQGVSRGIYAPSISYYNGLFYVTSTLVDIGGNFIVAAKDPAGLWSNPIWIPQINGIDPSMFFDEDGKAFIVYNSVAPDNKPLYDGHRTIRMFEFDIDSLKVKGEEKILVNGGVDLSKKPIWIEGPHIIKRDNIYYLIAAEGGTAEDHSEVVFKSHKADGSYLPCEKNPILTQRHLASMRKNPITCTGHADFVQTETGDWWAVFLGCRPYEDNYYNTGRETFLAPVKWDDKQPIILEADELVLYRYPYPIKPVKEFVERQYSGNFAWRDEFDKETLSGDWMFLRTPHEKWYDLSWKKGYINIRLRTETCAGNMNPSFLGHRQQHAQSSAGISMDFQPESENEKAGLLIFYNEERFYFLCKSIEQNEQTIQLYKSRTGSRQDKMELLASQKLSKEAAGKIIYLKIESRGKTYAFYYSFIPDKWNMFQDNIDGKFLSTRIAGGYVGCMYALYATSLGHVSNNIASYDWFEYIGTDETYK